MPEAIIVAILSLVGTLGGSFAGIIIANKLVNYRLGELEKKVEKHNNLVERMAVNERDIKTAFVRLDELRDDVHASAVSPSGALT